jgi:hypothetical protein
VLVGSQLLLVLLLLPPLLLRCLILLSPERCCWGRLWSSDSCRHRQRCC